MQITPFPAVLNFGKVYRSAPGQEAYKAELTAKNLVKARKSQNFHEQNPRSKKSFVRTTPTLLKNIKGRSGSSVILIGSRAQDIGCYNFYTEQPPIPGTQIVVVNQDGRCKEARKALWLRYELRRLDNLSESFMLQYFASETNTTPWQYAFLEQYGDQVNAVKHALDEFLKKAKLIPEQYAATLEQLYPT